MIEIIKATQLDYFDNSYIATNGLQVSRNDRVIVETPRGQEFLRVVKENYSVSKDNIVSPPSKLVRIATNDDVLKYENNLDKAAYALEFCKKSVEKLGLDMQLVNAKYTLDRKKLIFNFTADERIDFRALVKILANEFKTRIELRQISVRDEAKYLGGIGPCGRTHCCSTFLSDFAPVSIQMAKNQDLSLSPSKVSGACGRLMCCLKFEDEYYEESRNSLPDIGTYIFTPYGKGEVIGVNILDLTLRVKYEDDYIRELHNDELQKSEV